MGSNLSHCPRPSKPNGTSPLVNIRLVAPATHATTEIYNNKLTHALDPPVGPGKTGAKAPAKNIIEMEYIGLWSD